MKKSSEQVYIGELEHALKFYADPETYTGRAQGYAWAATIEDDKGSIAREALKKGAKAERAENECSEDRSGSPP